MIATKPDDRFYVAPVTMPDRSATFAVVDGGSEPHETLVMTGERPERLVAALNGLTLAVEEARRLASEALAAIAAIEARVRRCEGYLGMPTPRG